MAGSRISPPPFHPRPWALPAGTREALEGARIPPRIRMEDQVTGEDKLRIVLLGKTGVGKSSVGNTILGEKAFEEACSLTSETQICKRFEKEINGRTIVLVDTPGIFDTNRPEEDIRKEIISSLVECAPGPHVFILVLEVTRYTRENQEAVEKLLECFTGNAVHHMVLLFTQGENLDKKLHINKFISKFDDEGKKSGGKLLKDLAEKCGNRVHVIDNKHWNQNSRKSALLDEIKKLNVSDETLRDIIEKMPPDETDGTPWFNTLTDQTDSVETECQYDSEMREYRTNRFQLTQLMKSIKIILRDTNAEPFTNEALEEIEEAINEEENNIAQEENKEIGEVDPVEIRRRAKERVRIKIENGLAGVATGMLLGALLGVVVGVSAPVVLVAGLIRAGYRKVTHQRSQAGGAPVKRAGAAAAGAVAVGLMTAVAEAAIVGAGVGTGIGAGVGAGVCVLYGAGKGAMSGYKASMTSDKPGQAAKKVSQALVDKTGDVLGACWNVGNKTETGEEAQRLLRKNN